MLECGFPGLVPFLLSNLVQPSSGDVNVGMVAVLLLLIAWGDWRLAQRFVTGFQLIGRLERTGVFREANVADEVWSRDKLCEHSRKMLKTIDHDKGVPEHETQFLWDSCIEEVDSKKAEGPFSKEELDAKYPQCWAHVPSFVHTQPNGKMRRIDNGRLGGQNRASEMVERIHLCTAYQPGIAVKRLHDSLAEKVGAREVKNFTLESGSEDLPNAYRSIPVSLQDLPINIVSAQDPKTLVWYFFIMYGLLFGFESSVIQFGRWSLFTQVCGRTICGLVMAMYFDDANLVDLQAAKGEGQRLLNTLFECLGTPFSKKKQVRMSLSGSFLGVDHKFHNFPLYIEFRPRESLIEKLKGLLLEVWRTWLCTPAQAAKIVGVGQFMLHAAYSKVGKAALLAYIQRQHHDVPLFHLGKERWLVSYQMITSTQFLFMLLEDWPDKKVYLGPSYHYPVIIASDAQADPGKMPTGGLVAMWYSKGRLHTKAAYVRFPESLLEVWDFSKAQRDAGANCIAVCESVMIPLAMHYLAKHLVDADITFYIDNTTALFSMVKGVSNQVHVARCSHVAQLSTFLLGARVWYEFIPSACNWSDSISRELENCPFCKKHGIPIEEIVVPQEWFLESIAQTKQLLGTSMGINK